MFQILLKKKIKPNPNPQKIFPVHIPRVTNSKCEILLKKIKPNPYPPKNFPVHIMIFIKKNSEIYCRRV